MIFLYLLLYPIIQFVLNLNLLINPLTYYYIYIFFYHYIKYLNLIFYISFYHNIEYFNEIIYILSYYYNK